MKKWTKEKLVIKFKELQNKLGRQPTKKDWLEDPDTPSDMPIRTFFKKWNFFVLECGGVCKLSAISDIARENSRIAHIGKRSTAWKGGRLKDAHGYILIWAPDHPNCKSSGYVHEHRILMSNFLKRPLTDKENIHHKNGIRDDNRLENLELWSRSQPTGQRVEDKIKWAIAFLSEYGYEIKNLNYCNE